MDLQVRRLGNGLGAEVRGLDLGRLDGSTLQAIHAAWMEHLVLVFPRQQLTPLQFAAFTERFGPLEILGSYQGLDEYMDPACKGLMTVTNRNIRNEPSRTRAVGRKWHADRSFVPQAPLGTFLYCRELPEVGGDTMFSNQYMAYETLSAGLRRVLDGLWAVHDVLGRHDSLVKSLNQQQLALKRRMDPPTAQPMARTHEVTGKKALYVSEAVTTMIAGMTVEESRPLLGYLFRHSVKPEFTYRHRWRVDDVVMWDNRCAMHLAVADFDPAHIRTMLRTSVVGPVTGRTVEEIATAAPAA
jgi:taurine dioxygenase